MHLGKLHKLIVNNRKDISIPETKFIGKLIDTARINRDSQNQKSEETIEDNSKNPYATVMKNSFVSSDERSPLSNANAKAILDQRIERHNLIVEYLEKNISFDGLKKITEEIIKEDNLNLIIPQFSGNTAYNFIRKVDEEIENTLLEDKPSDVYADFITEYYYYSVLWNTVEYTLEGICDIRQPFYGVMQSNNPNEITTKYYEYNNKITSRHHKPNDCSCRFYCDKMFVNDKRTYSIYTIPSKEQPDFILTGKYNIPLDFINSIEERNVEISDNYIAIVGATKNNIYLYIYRSDESNVLKNLNLPLNYGMPYEVKIIKDELYLIYSDFYFIINLCDIIKKPIYYRKNNIESFEKKFNKFLCNPKYEIIKKIPFTDNSRIVDVIKSSFRIGESEHNLYKKSEFENVMPDYSTAYDPSKFTFRESKNEIIKMFSLSPSNRYIVLIDINQNSYIYDTAAAQTIINLTYNPAISPFVKYDQDDIVPKDVLESWHFSKDEQLFVMSHAKYSGKINNVTRTSEILVYDLNRPIEKPSKRGNLDLVGWIDEEHCFIAYDRKTQDSLIKYYVELQKEKSPALNSSKVKLINNNHSKEVDSKE